MNRKLSSHIGKYNGIFARLCIIWHCVENHRSVRPPIIVTADTAARVGTFMHEFLLPHAVAFYAGVLDLSDDHDQLKDVAGYILAHGLREITNRDVQRGSRTMRKMTKRDTDRVFDQLDAFGWVSRTSGKRPTDPPRCMVNLKVHRRFKERAAREASRRLETREAIARALKGTKGGPTRT